MTWLKTIGEELLGLFVDDVWLAAGILVWVAVARFWLTHLLPPGWDGVAFFAGVAALVAGTALRSAGPR